MIEAMSAGTPVIAWENGSVPEVISHGESGFIVNSIEAAVDAVKATAHLSRRGVRDYLESRFTADRMASAYVAAYKTLLQSGTPAKLHLVAAS